MLVYTCLLSKLYWFVIPHNSGSYDKSWGHTRSLSSARYRFRDPLVGDKIEVSWEGRFRLESLDVFVGRSWWEATVVQKVDGYR